MVSTHTDCNVTKLNEKLKITTELQLLLFIIELNFLSAPSTAAFEAHNLDCLGYVDHNAKHHLVW